MADITIVNGVYKPTNITGGHHPVGLNSASKVLQVPNARPSLYPPNLAIKLRLVYWFRMVDVG